MKKIFLNLLAVLSTILMTTHLRPDDFFTVKANVIKESRFKLAFLYFTPLLLLEDLGYSSNIFSYSEQVTPDWTGDIGVGLRASAIIANRLILQSEDTPYYSYYLENKELRTWSNRFGAKAYSYIGPLNLKAGYVLNDLNQRPYDEFSRPFHFTRSEWSGEVDLGRNSKLFLITYAKLNKLAYDEDPYLGNYYLAASLNRRESIFGLKLNRRIFSNTLIYLNYELKNYLFTMNSERDNRSHSISIGVVFPEVGILRGSFQIGLMRFAPKNHIFKPSQSLYGGGDIYMTLFERLRLNLFYSFGTNFSFTGNEFFYNNQTVGCGADLYLTRFLKASATYQEGRLKYHSFIDLGLQRTDWTSLQQYSLAVPFLGNASFGVAYSIYRLRSDVLNLDYIRSFWGGFINYAF